MPRVIGIDPGTVSTDMRDQPSERARLRASRRNNRVIIPSIPIDLQKTLPIYELESSVRVMLKPTGYTIRFPQEDGQPGEHGSVAIKDKDWKLFLKQANLKGRVQIEAVMKAWCRFGPNSLPESKFRFELHFQKGGKSVRIDAFKGHQVRFYGTTIQVDGKPMFIVTGHDYSKKRDPADQGTLAAAGKAALGILATSNDR